MKDYSELIRQLKDESTNPYDVRFTAALVLEELTRPKSKRDSYTGDYADFCKRISPERASALVDHVMRTGHRASLIAQGICPACEGEKEIGGQFTGGTQICPECNGTGKHAKD